MGRKDFCWINHDSGSRELWEAKPEKGQRCKTLNFEKSGKMLLAHLDFSVRKPPPACFYFLFILWSKETWLALLANKSDCTKTLHASISSSSQKKHDTEKPWIAAKHSKPKEHEISCSRILWFLCNIERILGVGCSARGAHVTYNCSSEHTEITENTAFCLWVAVVGWFLVTVKSTS